MISDEEKCKKNYERTKEDFLGERLSIPSIQYFWQASPLFPNKRKSIPKFLRALKVFSNFSDYELKIFSKFIHERKFSPDEIVIKEGDSGFGFYLIFNGAIEIYTKKTRTIEGVQEAYDQFVIKLGKYEYFGELSLLEKQNQRNATAVSKGHSTLLAVYIPDIEELIERYPVVGAKFLQAISIIVARRFNSVVEELKELKDKIIDMEAKVAK